LLAYISSDRQPASIMSDQPAAEQPAPATEATSEEATAPAAETTSEEAPAPAAEATSEEAPAPAAETEQPATTTESGSEG
jgi:hypothetical protein